MKQARKNTLHALGGAHDNAMRGLATGNRSGKGKREQVVNTPAEVWAMLYNLWPEGGIVDVCASEESLDIAKARLVISNVYALGGFNALRKRWPANPMYLNPPYGTLKAWLAHGKKYPGERVWLVPVRTHRTWWRQWRDSLDAYIECDPLAFHGFDQKFPAPLLLGYTGERVDMFAEYASEFGGFYAGARGLPRDSHART